MNGEIREIYLMWQKLDFNESMDLPALADEEEEEVLVTDDGQMFIRAADGSNKIRRLTGMAFEDILESRLMEMTNGIDGND